MIRFRTGTSVSVQQPVTELSRKIRQRETLSVSVRLGADVIGSMVLRGLLPSDSALQALTNLVAIALERARMIEANTAANLIRKSDELKSTLLDAIAHEFKTPLTSIKAAASALRSGVDNSSARQEYIAIVDEEADRLEHLVTGAIQMARVEAGDLHLRNQELAVAEVVGAATASVHSLLEDRAIERKIEAGLTVTADPELLQLALRQVLENALKYSPAGTGIFITARQDHGDILLTIADQGPGIPESEQFRIFDRYYRLEKTRDQVPGTGIGLAIARDIMAAHGGRIWTESNPGEGARFLLLFPGSEKKKAA